MAQTGHETRTASVEQRTLDVPEGQEAPPAEAYVVSLPTWEGPLDLLLSIIQRHELDILDIPIGFITEKYLEYLSMMRSMSIDVASEYLVMAATLAHIKSKMLLPEVPADQLDEGEAELEDPRSELVRRLLEYQKYKAAAEQLGSRDTLGTAVFARGTAEPAPEGPAPFASTSVFNLLDAFAKLLARTKAKIDHEVVFDRISITDRITQIVDVLKVRRQVAFEELFDESKTGRADLVVTFLAVLEMVRVNMLRVYQSDVLAPIHLELLVIDESSDEPET